MVSVVVDIINKINITLNSEKIVKVDAHTHSEGGRGREREMQRETYGEVP